MPIKVISDNPDSDEEDEYDMNYLDRCENVSYIKLGPSFSKRRGKYKFPIPTT